MAETRRTCPTCGGAYGVEALFCPRDGAPLAARKLDALGDPYLGLTIGGQLHLERLVGIGSMGRVYRAAQAGIGRNVAVKILHREHMKRHDLVARFQREARVAGGLAHPNLVTVHASGELAPGPERAAAEPYLVMEFLDGMTLRSALAAAGGRLRLDRALEVMLSICDALGEAHANGIVHRDLKPENVMLIRVGADPDFVKVLDFGVARVGEADSSIATHAGAILGTALYACPESARGDRVGPGGDVYSIATLLFECLAGAPPFTGAGPVDVLIQHAKSAPPDVRATDAGRDVPAPLATLVTQNLAKSPGDRAPDARKFGCSLVEAARASGLDAPRLTRRSTLLGALATVAAVLTTTLVASVAKAEPDGMRAARDESSVTHGMAEFGVGLFTLPGAKLCIDRQAGCGRGDSSLAVSAWPLFRRGNFAAGAGATLGLTSSTDAPHNDPPDVPRNHSRRYLSIEITARYYIPLSGRLESWVGITGGLGVVSDIFQTQKGLSDYAMVGPRSAVLLTEGFALGGGAGLSYELGENWLLGGHARLSEWFLPTTPLRGPFGDEASLTGAITAVDVGVTMAYRARLVF